MGQCVQDELPGLDASEEALAAAVGVESAEYNLVKWVTPNDTKATNSHQYGYHLPIESWPMFNDRAGGNGENLEREIRIHWYGHGVTESAWKWYGMGTRHEYRLTRFGRGFPYRESENVGSLLVIHSTEVQGEYRAYSLDEDQGIEDFLGLTGLSPGDIGQHFARGLEADECLDSETQKVLDAHQDFPSTADMSRLARAIAELCLGVTPTDPDVSLKGFTDVEFRLFRLFESRAFEQVVAEEAINTIDRLITQGNSFNNRRKSRAGRSLEHHIAACLAETGLPYDTQVKTEKKRTMDFMFPSQMAYDDPEYPDDKLIALAAKTSTKERWAQVLNEAGRCKQKFLLTTQPATVDTVADMAADGLTLVVPKAFLGEFPQAARRKVMTVEQFLEHVRETLADVEP